MSGEDGRGHLRELWRAGGYRRLISARLVSQAGDGLFQAALAGSVLFNPVQQTSQLKIAAGFAILLLPFSVLGPFVGVFLDRWDRRTVLYVSNLIRFGCALPAALLFGAVGPAWAPLALAFVISAVNRFFLAGMSASMPHVVVDRLLVTANAAASTLGSVAYTVGLAISGLLLGPLLGSNDTGYGWVAGAGAAMYLGSALLTRAWFARGTLGPDRAERVSGSWAAEVSGIARGMVAGLAHVAGRPRVVYAIGVQALSRLLYGVLTLATLLLYTRFFFHAYAAALGGLTQVVVGGSIGVMVAAAVTPAGTRAVGGRWWIAACTALIAVTLPPLALMFVPPLLVVATFIMNVSSQGIKIVVDTNVQRHIAENFRGRVFSVVDTLFNALYVAGLFIGALTLPPDGHSVPMIVAVSAGYLLVTLAYTGLTRDHRPLEEHDDLDRMPEPVPAGQ